MQPNVATFHVITDGVLAVVYFGRLIALVDGRGHFLFRDLSVPVWFVNYLLFQNHIIEKSRWN